MKKSKTANVAQVRNVLSVKAGNAPVKKFDVKDAETVEAESITVNPEADKPLQTAVSELPETTKEEVNPNPEASTDQQQEVVTADKKEDVVLPSMDDLKERVETLNLLQSKHTQIKEKRASLKKFEISHDNLNATIILKDANGLEFSSSSPKTIAKVLQFWDEEFGEAQAMTEKTLKDIFLGVA